MDFLSKIKLPHLSVWEYLHDVADLAVVHMKCFERFIKYDIHFSNSSGARFVVLGYIKYTI